MKFSTLLMAIAIAFLAVFSFTVNCQAIQILEMRPADGHSNDAISYQGGLYHCAYVRTDSPIYNIGWTVGGVTQGETFALDSAPTTAYFYPDFLTGEVTGTTYELSVEVWEWDEDDAVFRSDTDSYTLTVYGIMGKDTPLVFPKKYKNVFGYIELT